MGNFLNWIYRSVSADDFLDIVKSIGVIDWVVEAGVHDASDTIKLYESLNPNYYLGFEPDDKAYQRALEKLKEVNLTSKVKLFPYALSDSSKKVTIVTPTEFGTGQTQIEPNASGKIKAFAIADFIADYSDHGLLWLDVEGHALMVIQGAKKEVKKFMILKIEMQMRNMDKNRAQDSFLLHELLKRDFLLIRAPIHPGFFGDAVYLRRDLSTLRQRIYSLLLTLIFLSLNRFVYPWVSRNVQL